MTEYLCPRCDEIVAPDKADGCEDWDCPVNYGGLSEDDKLTGENDE